MTEGTNGPDLGHDMVTVALVAGLQQLSGALGSKALPISGESPLVDIIDVSLRYCGVWAREGLYEYEREAALALLALMTPPGKDARIDVTIKKLVQDGKMNILRFPAKHGSHYCLELPSVLNAEVHRITQERGPFIMTFYTKIAERYKQHIEHHPFVKPSEPGDLFAAAS